MTYLGTLFNFTYLSRGIALIESLNRHYKGGFHLFVLCLDKETLEYLRSKDYQSVEPVLINDVEEFYPELRSAKDNRTLFEYYFTLSPVFPLYILETYKVNQITTMDADIYFFSNPSILFEEIEKYSVSVMPHNFSEGLVYKGVYGKFNVSFQSFKNNSLGLQCLQRWKEQCLEWCYDTLDDNRFADQKYLNEWPVLYKDLYEIGIDGSGIAPWNLNRFLISLTGREGNLKDKLVFYHFHQLRFVGKNLIDLGLKDYSVYVNALILNKIYKPYIKKLLRFQHNQDEKISRNTKSLISFKKAILTENNYFFYAFGFMIRTATIQPFMSLLQRTIRYLIKK